MRSLGSMPGFLGGNIQCISLLHSAPAIPPSPQVIQLSHFLLCKKESQLQSKKMDFSQEKSRKSQFFWLFFDFSSTFLDWNLFFLTVTNFLFYRASCMMHLTRSLGSMPGFLVGAFDSPPSALDLAMGTRIHASPSRVTSSAVISSVVLLQDGNSFASATVSQLCWQVTYTWQ